MKALKRFRAWCYGCDQYLVEGGKKCPVCGQRLPVKKSRLTDKIEQRREKSVIKGW